MYGLKPILVDQKIELPKCMYHLKTVNNVEGAGNMEESINSSVSGNCIPNSAETTRRIFILGKDRGGGAWREAAEDSGEAGFAEEDVDLDARRFEVVQQTGAATAPAAESHEVRL